jgi:hypothetical protein
MRPLFFPFGFLISVHDGKGNHQIEIVYLEELEELAPYSEKSNDMQMIVEVKWKVKSSTSIKLKGTPKTQKRDQNFAIIESQSEIGEIYQTLIDARLGTSKNLDILGNIIDIDGNSIISVEKETRTKEIAFFLTDRLQTSKFATFTTTFPEARDLKINTLSHFYRGFIILFTEECVAIITVQGTRLATISMKKISSIEFVDPSHILVKFGAKICLINISQPRKPTVVYTSKSETLFLGITPVMGLFGVFVPSTHLIQVFNISGQQVFECRLSSHEKTLRLVS